MAIHKDVTGLEEKRLHDLDQKRQARKETRPTQVLLSHALICASNFRMCSHLRRQSRLYRWRWTTMTRKSNTQSKKLTKRKILFKRTYVPKTLISNVTAFLSNLTTASHAYKPSCLSGWSEPSRKVLLKFWRRKKSPKSLILLPFWYQKILGTGLDKGRKKYISHITLVFF